MRHRWQLIAGHSTTYRCTRPGCGATKQRRPHPYGRQWFTEYGDGRGNYSEKAPPCEGRDERAASTEKANA